MWAKKSTGGRKNSGNVVLDSIGNIYLCGSNMESDSFDAYTIPRGGFIAKYDINGNCIWAKNKFRYQASTISEAVPYSIKIYDSNILISGSTYNDTIVVDTITTSYNGNNAVFLSSFDMDGNIKWLRIMASPNGTGGSKSSIDSEGNSYITGLLTSTGVFDTILLTNALQDDAFLAKYDINGNLKYVKQLNASGGAWGRVVSTTSDGTTYITGYFSGTANFGSYTVTSATTRDMFVARYDSVGTCLGVYNFGKAEGGAVYVNDNNSFWVSGVFSSPTVTLGNTTLTNYGFNNDIYIAKGDAPIGIEKYERKTMKALNIYDNPNKGTCNITIPDELLNEQNLVLTIYDNNGKIIQQQQVKIEREKIKINLEAEAKGIYNVTLGNAKKMYSGKIVFE